MRSILRKAKCLLLVCIALSITIMILFNADVIMKSYRIKNKQEVKHNDDMTQPLTEIHISNNVMKNIHKENLTASIFSTNLSTREKENPTSDKKKPETHTRNLKKKEKFNKNIKNKSPNSAFVKLGFSNLAIMKVQSEQRPLFEFTLRPKKIDVLRPTAHQTINTPCQEIKWSMIVMVKSHADHGDRRKRIRADWGFFKYVNGVRLETVFVVGRSENPFSNFHLMLEYLKYADLLQIDREEIYPDVGYKTLAGMQWVSQHLPAHWFYTSADDDMMPNLMRIFSKLEDMMKEVKRKRNSNCPTKNTCANSTYDPEILTQLPILCGYTFGEKGKPNRFNRSKWYIDKITYPHPYFPSCCFGGWYTMPVKLTAGIYEISRQHSYLFLDDVWITGLLRLSYYGNRDVACRDCDVTDEKVGILGEHLGLVLHMPDDDQRTVRWRILKKRMLKVASGYILKDDGRCWTYDQSEAELHIKVLVLIFLVLFVYCWLAVLYVGRIDE